MTTPNKYYSRYFTYIQPTLRSPIVKTYGSTVFTLIAMSIFIFFAIKPTVETIVVLQKKLDNSREVLKKITQKSEDLIQARKNYQNIDQETKYKIASAIPGNTQIHTVIQTLEATALYNQASISALQIQPLTIESKDKTAKELKLAEIEFTYKVEATYSNLLNVLDQLKSANRLITIDKLTFNKVETEKTVVLSITGRAFYLK